MITATIPTPSGEEMAATFAVIGDEDLVHVVWDCDPDRALCGQSAPGDDYVEDDDVGPWCPECVAIDRAQEAAHIVSCAVCREAS
jgi:hypothetical protein